TPTCQVIPPGVPGYRPYCPYTLHPGSSGRWRAPNIARARALVAASHTRGEAISLWSSTDDPAEGRRVLAYVARVLDRLGYRARVRVVSRPELDRSFEQGRVQGAANEWYGGETGAGEFLHTFLACNGEGGHHWFCSPNLDRLMARAAALAGTNSTLSNADWAKADRLAVDSAALVP